MADFLTGLGVWLAFAGPFLLIPIVWLLYRFALRPFFGSRLQAAAVSTALVTLLLAATYFPGKRDFDRMCEAQGSPKIERRVEVEGFFRTAMFPYEAVLYLTQDGFRFVEAPDPYREGVMIRYSFAPNGEVRQDEATRLESRYGVRKTYGLLKGGVTKSEKVVYEIATGEEVARATELVYQGGPLALFLGTLGMTSCPDPRTVQGSRDFQIFYDLESYVLGGADLP